MKTSLRPEKIKRCGEDRGQNETISGLQVHTRSLPRPYYVHTASLLGSY